MSVTINGDTGVSKVQDGVVVQADLATGVAGTGPAFSATQSAGTSLTTSVTTKILFATEEFDTNSNFASSTFTPTVAGYYQVSACVGMNSTSANVHVYIYKNGANYKEGSNPTASFQVALSCLVYCNGTTDYLDVYCLQNAATQNTDTSSANTWFQAAMIRSAV
jgi:hypothetical protein